MRASPRRHRSAVETEVTSSPRKRTRPLVGARAPPTGGGRGVFAGLPDPFEATRYHSLVVEQASLPACLEITAWTENPDGSIDEIMGLRHKTLPVEGVQFHPESILTRHGHDMLRNFLGLPLRLAA